ncbi:MAG TPA: hypothetical protein VF175_17995, partial [Lacipirellula sp.]
VVGTTVAEAADTYVRGHFRSNGTYVQPHYRSAPDGNRYNNFSTRGNINPYTGQIGTKSPYSQGYGLGSGSGLGSSSQGYRPFGYGSRPGTSLYGD